MRLPLAVILLAALCVVSAQRAPASIVLDVVVDGGGRQPLTAADFRVTQGGQLLVVSSVRGVEPPAAPTPLPPVITDENEETAAASAARLVAVYVDEYHLQDGPAFVSARSALASFLRSALGPDDLVVVLKPLDSLLSIRMGSDREAAARIVESAVPRQGDYTARSTFEQNFIAGAPARIDAARNQIALSSVSALATHLGRFDAGRKTLIVLSNGFAAQPASREQFLPGLESIARVANRDRVAVYGIRPSAMVQPSRDVVDGGAAPRDLLSTLAQQTTGLVVDGESASAGLARVARESSHYYLLTIAPGDVEADGRFRSVDVSVRRPGTTVRARAGYVVSRPAPPLSRRSAIPEGLKVPRRSSTLIRTWFGQSDGGDGSTRVAFVWEPAPRVPGVPGLPAVASRVSMSVTTLEGTAVFSGSIPPSGGEVISAAGQLPQLTFEAAPGQVLVQMEILDPSGRVLDRDVRDLMVSKFAEPVAFGTAAVFRARTMPALRAVADGKTDAAPVAARQFSRAEQLLVRVPLSARGDAPPRVTAQLESRFGAVLRPVTVTRATPSSVDVQLPLAGLASGGYALAFEAHAGGTTARTRVDFAVTP